MPNIGWFELLILMVLAIVVVGPKDLPRLMRTLGYWMGRARAMAREFQESFEEMGREAELEELRKELGDIESNAIDAAREPTLDADLEASEDPSDMQSGNEVPRDEERP